MYLNGLDKNDLKVIYQALVYWSDKYLDPMDYEAANSGDDYFKTDKRSVKKLLVKLRDLASK